ncbi:hypothetical protein EYF80_046540 [Liparis tanakae]|uniref:Uncharacterized protein n=1 Tax=Liparis tanakae TaxID=230148 RepID=A0A4Z2FQ34_9TELE|nr:hypothetical protein EYF80_046540 [Liparis tanakae]
MERHMFIHQQHLACSGGLVGLFANMPVHKCQQVCRIAHREAEPTGPSGRSRHSFNNTCAKDYQSN